MENSKIYDVYDLAIAREDFENCLSPKLNETMDKLFALVSIYLLNDKKFFENFLIGVVNDRHQAFFDSVEQFKYCAFLAFDYFAKEVYECYVPGNPEETLAAMIEAVNKAETES